MEAKALFVENYQEINNALNINIDPPEKIYKWSTVYFSIKDISFSHRDVDGNIVVYIYGMRWTLQYSDELYARIKQELGSRGAKS